ncbi:MAG: 16S rRNA (uracil(1498)-N(3))-methyltransferase [Myxococcales bacterium]|nr:16S rRNA (uracil(1498)-N(3))-methyltransferase [Myxococcales bacterium]
MTLRAAVGSLVAGERDLDAATSRYLVRVHRLRVGEAFVVFDVESGLEADAELLVAEPRRARARVGEPRPARVSAPLPVTLLWSLGKGDKPESVIRDATALGVARVVLVTTERTVPRLGERGEGRRERWQSVAREAARQSGRGDLPELVGPLALGDALGLLPEALGVVLDPEAEAPLRAVLSDWRPSASLRVLVGPEGGLAQHELAAAREAGFRPARFGRLTLRTETAAVAVLGALVALAETP